MRCRQRAVVLIEIMVLLGLLTAFAAVAARLLTTNMRLMRQAQHQQEMTVRFDQAMQQLRRDVWTAAGYSVEDGRLVLEYPDGARLVWEADEEGSLVRRGEEAPITRWHDLGPLVHVELDGPLARVRVIDDVELVMPSQLLLLREGR